MSNINQQRGFGPIAIIVVIAIVAAVGGGGVYYASKQAAKSEIAAETNTEVNTGVNGDASATISVDTGAVKGTLRSLIAIGKDVRCAVIGPTASGTTNGTVYVSGSMMRGDFTTSSSTSGSTESHVIRQGDQMFVWSGSQGAKMSLTDMENNAQASAKAGVDMNSEVTYDCKSWTKDASKFTVPTTVSFVDLKAMLDGSIKIPGQ